MLSIEFVGGPYDGETIELPGGKDQDTIQIAGSDDERYVYELIADRAYFVEMKV